jgi:hypothetical protein
LGVYLVYIMDRAVTERERRVRLYCAVGYLLRSILPVCGLLRPDIDVPCVLLLLYGRGIRL